MKALLALFVLLFASCSNHCYNPIMVAGPGGYYHDCKEECHKPTKPEGFECRCTRLCVCHAKHEASTSRP